MTPRSPLRKLMLDLTPLIDMITILMFGVMIHAVELSRQAVEHSQQEEARAGSAVDRSDADRKALLEVGERARYLAERESQLAERLKELQERLGKKEEELRALQLRIDQEHRDVAEALGKLLGGLDQEALKKALGQHDLSESGAKRILKALQQADNDTAAAFKAVRRIAEMEKVFTFIDLHLDGKDVLTIAVNGQKVDHLPMHGKSPLEVENLLRGKFQGPDFNQVVLFMFSTEGDATFKTARAIEQGIKSLREHYEGRFPTKQFRYAPIGTVTHAPPTIEKGR